MATTQRQPRAERRKQITGAVLRIIGESGLRSLTTARLAQEVGVTSGALYRHFASLDEILSETVRSGVQSLEATFPEPDLPARDRLLVLARNRVQLLGGNAGLTWLLRSEQAYLALPDDAVARLRRVVQRSRTFLLQALRDGIAEGSIRSDVEPELLLIPVMATVHAAIAIAKPRRRVASGAEPLEPERVLQALLRLLEPPRAPAAMRRDPTEERNQK